jgi:Leucine Rich repeat
MKLSGNTAVKVALVVTAITGIVAWEIGGLFQYSAIERIGGSVAHLGEFGIGGHTVIKDGYSIRFDRPISDSELATIQDQLRSFRRLKLELGESNITNMGIKELAGASNIHSLGVESTAIGDDGLATIATLTELVELDLTRCRVTDAGLPRLKALQKLGFLYLTGNEITDEGLIHLRELRGLKKVVIGWGAITPAGSAQLQAQIPHAEVVRVGPPYEDRLADQRVTAQNGSPLPADGGPIIDVCRQYFQAWQELDVYTLKKLSIAESAGWFRNVGKEYQDIRPSKITFFSGFANETDATVIVGGPSHEYSHVNYIVQLKLEDGHWRIAAASMKQ